MRGEDQLIERIARAVPSILGARVSNRDGLILGIGDDSAVLRVGKGKQLALSCDAFLEGIHFLGNLHPADSVGYKSLARATSDLAAMGAEPRYFMLTLALPAERTGKWLDKFLEGLGRAAGELGMKLVGGDTTRNRAVSISVTVLGEVQRDAALGRAGARAGDVIYVTGNLGEAALGLKLLKGRTLKPSGAARIADHRFLRAHLFPRIRVRLASWLARYDIPSAMMDISDGLSTDLYRLCRASSVGARIWADRIPQAQIPIFMKRSAKRGVQRGEALELALHGGDDYELLFTVPPQRTKKLRDAPQASEITEIGVIERGNRIRLVDQNGRAKILKRAGWDPFAKS